MNLKIVKIVRIAIIASLYVVLTLAFMPLSFGSIQIRFSEALVILPFILPEAILGVTMGCFISNLFSPFGLIDVIFGSLFTLIAAYLTYLIGKSKNKKEWMLFLAPLPPILINGFGVSLYVAFLSNFKGGLSFTSLIEAFNIISKDFTFSPYFIVTLSIIAGEAIATYILGIPLTLGIKKFIKSVEHEI